MGDCVIKKLIKEQLDKLIGESVDKNCYKMFGDFLFADPDVNYSLKTWHKGKYEQNTKYEDRVWAILSNWVESGIRETGFEEALKNLHKCRSSYSRELEPKAKIFYRHVQLVSKYSTGFYKFIQHQDILNYDWLTQFDHNEYEDVILMSNKFKYTPLYTIESWTPRRKAANKFLIGPDMRNVEFPHILIEAKIPTNEIIMNPNFTQKIANSHSYDEEFESLRFVKTPIDNCKVYMTKRNILNIKRFSKEEYR